MSENALEKELFLFNGDEKYRYDVVMLSKKPTNALKVNDLNIADTILDFAKMILNESLIPDVTFIENNKFCYSVACNPKVELPFPWNNGYDIVYLCYEVNDLRILLAFIGTNSHGTTYLYMKKMNKGKIEKIDKDNLSIILNKDAYKLIRFIGNNKNDIDLYGQNAVMKSFPSPVIPVYQNQHAICLVKAHRFNNTLRPSMDYNLNEWFKLNKMWEKTSKEDAQKKNVIDKLIEERTEKCKKLIQTEQGRVELIRLLESNEGKEEFGGVNFCYNEFHKLPFDALLQYYYGDNSTAQYVNQADPIYFWHEEILTQQEIDALRKLLQSKNKTAKQYALRLIEVADVKSLLPDLLKLTNEKEKITPIPPAPTPEFQQRFYNSYIYFVLGKRGDQRTLKSLEQLYLSDKISKETKDDVKLAIENIKFNLDARKRQQQYWLDQRRRVREKKTAILSPDNPLMIDLDKPDPEPIDVDGYRNWSTTDGLFKTFAKFVGLQDNAAIKERDV
ncbi:MAG: hypothetical protein LBC68_09400, partial [Prevotellaceae bacterium]|nr:hypothetical protein [Prevotellaceae bacterium]